MTNVFEQFFGKDKMTDKTESTNEVPAQDSKHKDTRFVGRITKVDGKGFGFILCPEIPFTRIFFHWSSLKQETKKFTDLKNGMKVEFNAIEFVDKNTGQSKGTRAIKIMVIE